jgi:hypothetical protein
MAYGIKIKKMKAKTCTLLLLSALALQAQDSLKKRFIGLDLAGARHASFRSAFYPSLTFTAGKHILFAGPALNYLGAGQTQPMYGVQAGYQFFPNDNNKRVNLLFELNTIYVKGRFNEKFTNYGDFVAPVSGERSINMVSLDNYFSFGFRLNFLKRFYLKTTYGLSIGFYKTEYTYTYANGEVYGASGNLYPKNLSLSNRMFKMSIGCDLIRLHKKTH